MKNLRRICSTGSKYASGDCFETGLMSEIYLFMSSEIKPSVNRHGEQVS